jgi:hypothetical protein
MGKLSDDSIARWVAAGERFEMRGDGDGLYLSFRENYRSPIWLFRYRQNGIQRKLSLGRYPALTLLDARKIAQRYREIIATGKSLEDAHLETEYLRKLAEQKAMRTAKRNTRLASVFASLIQTATRHGAKRMTVSIEFDDGEVMTWES